MDVCSKYSLIRVFCQFLDNKKPHIACSSKIDEHFMIKRLMFIANDPQVNSLAVI